MSSFKKPAVFLLISLFFATVCGQQLDILSSDEIFQDESLTVTCDARRFILPSPTKLVSILKISRQVGSEQESFITQYNPFTIIKTARKAKNIPPGREWNITFTGGEPVNGTNKDTMTLVLRISDTKCDDTGIYQCLVTYLDEILVDRKLKVAQNLVVKAAIENHLLTAVPHNGSDLLYSLYPLGSNVTLTCRIQGPPGLTMKWQEKLATDPDFTDYDALNDTVTKDPELVLNGSTNCTEYRYESTLNLVIEEKDQFTTSYPALYQCVVSDDFVDLSKVKITLDLDTQDNKDDSTFASSTSDTGIIIGCVLGGLALITIFLGYGLKYRKKPKEDEEDTESSDGTTTHSDPPVPKSHNYFPPINEENETSVDDSSAQSLDTVISVISDISKQE